MHKVSNCGMSDAIGPVNIKERPSSEMQSRIDAEASVVNLYTLTKNIMFPLFASSSKKCFIKNKSHTPLPILQVVKLLREAYDRVKALLKKVCLIKLLSINFLQSGNFFFLFWGWPSVLKE